MSAGKWLASHAYHVGVAEARWFIPLLTTLDKIEISTALFKPWPEAHNIWEHLLHIQFWLKEGMLRMEGQREDAEAELELHVQGHAASLVAREVGIVGPGH